MLPQYQLQITATPSSNSATIKNFITPCIPLSRSIKKGMDKEVLEISGPRESQCHQQSVISKHMAVIIYNMPVQAMFTQDFSIWRNFAKHLM